ncbi:hypothetical protein BGZ63DRAFT_396996, partial [Mariannaea sp. PMI_226]
MLLLPTSSAAWHWLVVTSQILTVLLSDADARRWPSCENAAHSEAPTGLLDYAHFILKRHPSAALYRVGVALSVLKGL